MIDYKRHHMTPLTRSTRFKALVLILVFNHTTLVLFIRYDLHSLGDDDALRLYMTGLQIEILTEIIPWIVKDLKSPGSNLPLPNNRCALPGDDASWVEAVVCRSTNQGEALVSPSVTCLTTCTKRWGFWCALTIGR